MSTVADAPVVVVAAAPAATPAAPTPSVPAPTHRVEFSVLLSQLLELAAVPPPSTAVLQNLFTTMVNLLTAPDIDTLIGEIPSAAIALYNDLGAFTTCTKAQAIQVVSASIVAYISNIPELSPAQLGVLTTIVQRVVVKMLTAIPEGFAYIDQEVEATGFWQSMCGKKAPKPKPPAPIPATPATSAPSASSITFKRS